MEKKIEFQYVSLQWGRHFNRHRLDIFHQFQTIHLGLMSIVFVHMYIMTFRLRRTGIAHFQLRNSFSVPFSLSSF